MFLSFVCNFVNVCERPEHVPGSAYEIPQSTYSSIPFLLFKICIFGCLVAQSVECLTLDFGLGRDLRVVRLSPM